MQNAFDVLIIGAGVVGSAVARELARYKLSIAVVEKNPDVCCETSGRNSGVLHAGYNNEPDSLMAKFCVQGNRGFDAVATELSVPYKRTGKLVVGFGEEDMPKLLALKAQGEQNGVPMELVDRAFIKQKAPHVDGDFALWSPSTAILNPFQYTIALAENAAKNGVSFLLKQEVTAISYNKNDQLYTVSTNCGDLTSRWVINCAGLGSDKISTMLGIDEYTIYPCRGEYFILDQSVGSLLPLPVYPVPSIKTGGLGIHLTPTVDGNILVGPSTEYIDSREDYSSTQDTMKLLIEDGSRIFPHLKKEYFIRNFAGIRPKLTPKGVGGFHDFVIERRDDLAPHAVNLVGIESPGLTASIPIAMRVIELIKEVEPLTINPLFDPIREGFTTFNDKTHEEQAALIDSNPDYGEIICRCECITKAEVLAAINNPLRVDTVTGIKYRCRTMMGRCQGGYCQTRIAELILSEKHKARQELLYNRQNSMLFTGTVR